MARIKASLARFFFHHNLKSRIEFEINETRSTLLTHQAALEHYQSTVPMLEKRLARLNKLHEKQGK